MKRLALLLFLLWAPLASAQGPAESVLPGVQPSGPPSVPIDVTPPNLIVDLASPRVSITSAFQGESLLLFGMFDPPGEIVVVVVGPPGRETVLRKERFLGLWLNAGRQVFGDAPAYYFIAASQPLQRLLARGTGGEILSLDDRLASLHPLSARPEARAMLTSRLNAPPTGTLSGYWALRACLKTG